MKCKWCNEKYYWGPNHLHYILAKKRKPFYACDKCLKEHGREEDYDIPSPFNDLLAELGV